jgi:cell division protein ZapA
LKQAVQVTILGQQYTIRSAMAPEEVCRVAEFVNEKIAEIVTASKSVDTLNTAILALLNVGEAYLRLRDAAETREETLNTQLQELVARLEAACPEGSSHDC